MSVIMSEMPDDCLECPLSYFDYYFTDIPLRCPLMSDRIELDKTKRHKDCPLKSIDGLIEKLNKAGADNDKSVFKNLHPSYVQGLKDVVKIIKEYCDMEGE